MTTHAKLDRALLTTLGLSAESANIVMEHVDEIRALELEADADSKRLLALVWKGRRWNELLELELANLRSIKPVCYVCEQLMEQRGDDATDYICVNCDRAYRESQKMLHATITERDAPLVVLPTTTEAETVAAVREAGYVCVLCDDPAKVKVILAGNDVVGGDLMMSALTGLCSKYAGDPCKSAMVEDLLRRLLEREAGH